MPSRSLNFDEFDTKEVLVDLQDCRHDNRDREVLFDEHVIKVEGLLDILSVIVAVVPDVEFAVKWKAFLFVLFFLHGKEGLTLLDTDRTEFGLKIIQKLPGREFREMEELGGNLRP